MFTFSLKMLTRGSPRIILTPNKRLSTVMSKLILFRTVYHILRNCTFFLFKCLCSYWVGCITSPEVACSKLQAMLTKSIQEFKVSCRR